MSKTNQETSKTKQMRTKEEIMARATSLQGCNVTPDYSPIFRSLLDVLIDIRDIQYNKKVYMELKQKKLDKEIKRAIRDLDGENDTEEHIGNVHGKGEGVSVKPSISEKLAHAEEQRLEENTKQIKSWKKRDW
jgi:hypothetical protein